MQTVCGPNQYLNALSQCTDCDTKCKCCTITSTNCVSCTIGYYRNITGSCLQCKDNCRLCFTLEECVECNQGYTLDTGNCVAEENNNLLIILFTVFSCLLFCIGGSVLVFCCCRRKRAKVIGITRPAGEGHNIYPMRDRFSPARYSFGGDQGASVPMVPGHRGPHDGVHPSTHRALRSEHPQDYQRAHASPIGADEYLPSGALSQMLSPPPQLPPPPLIEIRSTKIQENNKSTYE